jgi:hypothetical protein
MNRKLLTALASAGIMAVGVGATATPALAKQRVFLVTFTDGSTVTLMLDVPAETPLEQVQLPALPLPVAEVTELPPDAVPTPTATAIPTLTATPTQTGTATPTVTQSPFPSVTPTTTPTTTPTATATVTVTPTATPEEGEAGKKAKPATPNAATAPLGRRVVKDAEKARRQAAQQRAA